MLGATDYVGLATAISALGAAVIGIIVALRQTAVKAIAADTNAKVTTKNGESVASIVEANDLRYLDPKNPPPKPAP